MGSSSPQAAGQRPERRLAPATGAEPNPDDSMPLAKRIKHDNNKYQHNSNDATPSSVASALPEEILLAIFSDINARTNQVRNSANDSFWSSSDILNIALTCRRFYRILASRLFESWCHRTWSAKDGKHRQDWSPCLRAILRQPVLGTYLRTVEVGLGEVYYWKIGDKANERGDLDNWLENDFELADAVVNELCTRDVWRGFPGGIWKIVPPESERSWDGNRVQRRIEQITAEEASQEWSRCIRAGRCDAILALLMVLAPNMEELRISEFEGLERYGSHSWDGFRIGEDSNFLARIFRGATNSQLSGLTIAAGGKTQRMGDLLPCLRNIEIRTQDDDTRRTEVKQVLPYLTLPSLEYASLRELEDMWGTDKDVHGVKLFLKALDVAFLNSEGIASISRVLSCCPNIEHLSYSSTGEFRDTETNWEEPGGLVNQLSDIVPQLKSLTIGTTEFMGMDGGAAIPSFDRSDFEDVAFLEQLTSLDLQWDHISNDVANHELPCALWRMLPKNLEKLTVQNIWPEDFEHVLEQVRGLAVTREEGFLPNMKELILCHTRSGMVANVDNVDEDEENYFTAMEEACRDAPITVKQVYGEIVTSLDIEWDDVPLVIMGIDGGLWRILRGTLESLTIRNFSGKFFFQLLLQQMRELIEWKQKLMPSLKELVIVHDSTESEVKREMGADVFDRMEDACRSAGVNVKQVFKEDVYA